MKALLFKGKDFPLSLAEVPAPSPGKDQVLIRIQVAGLNHLDLWIRKEQSVVSERGNILGADGCGTVESVGEGTDPSLVGKMVIINPSHEWGKNPNIQSDAFKILGYPDNGTFAEYVVVHKKYIHEKPEHLSIEEAAATPLAALTAYRALFTKARLRPEEKVLITGIGGGAALWALQLALAFQAKVFVTSSSQEKIDKAKALGATEGFNYNDADWVSKASKVSRGFDVILDSAGGAGFANLMQAAVPGGRIIVFGRTKGNIPDISTRLLYFRQLSILGTTMGTPDEFLSMLDFIEKRKVKPVIDRTYSLEEAAQAMEYMESGKHFGKIMLKVQEG